MMNWMKKQMLLMAAVALMVVSLAAPAAAMADEGQDRSNDPNGTGPVVRDHRDGGSSSGVVNEEPLKDPGIRQCDILPIECPDTEDSPNDDHGHNPGGAHPDADDPHPVEKEEPKDEEGARAPGTVKGAEVVGGITTTTIAQGNDASAAPRPLSTPDEAGQTANSDPDIHGCPFEYDYDEDLDVCVPSAESFDFFPILYGDEPWPDTVGGNVALPGEAGGDLLIGLGGAISGVGGIIEKGLDWYGEDGGPIGWGIQGIGQTIGFATDLVGTIVSGAGEVVGGVSEAVGDAIDAVGDAAEDAWDEISSWW